MIAILPQYSWVEEMPAETMPVDRTCIIEHDDDMQSLIFAPDPVTGFPNSQIPVEVEKSANVEIREYVNKYRQPSGENIVGVTDVKEGFASIVSRYAQYGAEVDEEIDRLQGVVKDKVKETLQK